MCEQLTDESASNVNLTPAQKENLEPFFLQFLNKRRNLNLVAPREIADVVCIEKLW